MTEKMDLSMFTPHLSSLQEVINRRQPTEVNMLWQLFSIFIYERAKSDELLELYKTLDLTTFAKVIHILGGKQIQFPTKTEIEENLIAALLYMDREVYGLSWEVIKEKYPMLNIQSLKYAMKIKSINSYMQDQLSQLVDPKEPIVEEVYISDLFGDEA